MSACTDVVLFHSVICVISCYVGCCILQKNIYKRKENRDISLLSIVGKILPRVLLKRLLQHLKAGLLLEIQCGFHAERETSDIIFAARQPQEK